MKADPESQRVPLPRRCIVLKALHAKNEQHPCDGVMLGLYTSQVDAWKVAKPIGASMWRCTPNSDACERIGCE